MPAIGFVRRCNDGSYRGELKTLTIQTLLEIRPVRDKIESHHPGFRIYASDNVEIGSARRMVGKGSARRYVSLSLAAPEFGAKPITAILGRIADQDDKRLFAIIWNPDE